MSTFNPNEACSHIELERSPVADVSVCVACQIVHVNLQHMSLRFRPEAFQALVLTLQGAEFKLKSLKEGVAEGFGYSEAINTSMRAEKLH